ncbi:MAG TPA: hypothetical protein VIY86_12110, partial [Pirellulaceae bacterium]
MGSVEGWIRGLRWSLVIVGCFVGLRMITQVRRPPQVIVRGPTAEPGHTSTDPLNSQVQQTPGSPGTARDTWLADFEPDVFGDFVDGTVFRRQEQPLWFAILATLKSMEPERLANQSLGRVGFLELYQQPDVYRGHIVTLQGRFHRLEYLEAPQNTVGGSGAWQGWLQPEGSNDPVVVYLPRLPQGCPEGRSTDFQALVHGVFLKRWAYEAEDGIRTAPLVLGRIASWWPTAEQPPPEPQVVAVAEIPARKPEKKSNRDETGAGNAL